MCSYARLGMSGVSSVRLNVPSIRSSALKRAQGPVQPNRVNGKRAIGASPYSARLSLGLTCDFDLIFRREPQGAFAGHWSSRFSPPTGPGTTYS